MRVPRELRDEIYTYVLDISPCSSLRPVVRISRSPSARITFLSQAYNSNVKADEKPLGLRPSLLAVNHQVGAEAAAALYAQTLTFWNIEALLIFLGDTPFPNRSWLTRIVVGEAFNRCYRA